MVRYAGNNTLSKSGKDWWASDIGGGFSYRYRYDPVFYGQVSAAGTFFLTLLFAAFVFFFGTRTNDDYTMVFIILGIGTFISFLYLVLGPTYKRWDLRSSINYCQRRLGKRATEAAVQECLETREMEERLGGGGGGFWWGMLFGSALNNN